MADTDADARLHHALTRVHARFETYDAQRADAWAFLASTNPNGGAASRWADTGRDIPRTGY